MKIKNICVVSGARSEYGILTLLLKKIEKSKSLKLSLIVTGMHLLKKYGETINYIKADKIPITDIIPMYGENDSNEMDLGKAIGKAGEHVKDLMAKLQKKIDVIPFSDDLQTFIQFILNTSKNSIKVQNIEIKESKNQKKTVIISVRPQDRRK